VHLSTRPLRYGTGLVGFARDFDAQVWAYHRKSDVGQIYPLRQRRFGVGAIVILHCNPLTRHERQRHVRFGRSKISEFSADTAEIKAPQKVSDDLGVAGPGASAVSG
jgi:hypothetical protein